MRSPAKTLVLFAHPAPLRSRANRALLDALRGAPGVTIHDLYATYPDLYIDIAREQDLLRAHDVLVFQHPLYWYSAPALLKEWMDVVLQHGFAYGDTGRALDGKVWMQAVTAGGREQAYTPSGHNRFTIEELLRPFEATAWLCRCRWRPPFILHASHLCPEASLLAKAEAYRDRVLALGLGIEESAPA